MATYFLDSSAILKRYVTETGSSWIRQMFDPPVVNHILASAVSSVEVIAAIARRAQGGGLSIQDGSRIVREFRMDLKSDYSLVNLMAPVIQLAMDLAEQHALRGYDAVQLAAALAARSAAVATGTDLTFVSADLELNCRTFKRARGGRPKSASVVLSS